MKRSITVAALGLALLAGCSSSEGSQEPSTTTTTEAAPPTITGTVNLSDSDGWSYYPKDMPRMMYDGELCFPSSRSGYTDIAEGAQVVAKNSTGEIIGVCSLREGGLTGFGAGGFEVTDNNYNGRLGGADCTFDFTIVLSDVTSFYSVGTEGRGDLNYSHAQMESSGWVVHLTIG
jgi:hypothetical protein